MRRSLIGLVAVALLASAAPAQATHGYVGLRAAEALIVRHDARGWDHEVFFLSVKRLSPTALRFHTHERPKDVLPGEFAVTSDLVVTVRRTHGRLRVHDRLLAGWVDVDV